MGNGCDFLEWTTFAQANFRLLWLTDAQIPVCRSLDRPTALVDQVVVVRAQQRRVVQAVFAPVQPVPDVVALQESVVGATRA